MNDGHYIFTVAVGRKHARHSMNLLASADRHGLMLDVLSPAMMPHTNPKCMKWHGITNAPSDAEHITYLDADTLIIEPFGRPTGSVLEDWTKADDKIVGGRREAEQYRTMIRRRYRGLLESPFANLRWNSGFISGPAQLMRDLAKEWATAWWRVEKATGRVHRDQSSYRLAYWQLHQAGLLPASLDRRFNWIIKRWGWSTDVRVLHKAGDPLPKGLRRKWEQLVENIHVEGVRRAFSDPR